MASRALTHTESRYSNIGRECLAVVFGLKKFEYYLYGRKVIVETDHSPLEQIFKKNIAEAPARLQRLLLRCMKFDITVRYKAGKSIPVADTLSRVCFRAGADVQNAVADVQNAVADVHNAGADVHKAGADLNKAGADLNNAGVGLNNAGIDLNKAGADLNKTGANVNREIHFITT